MLNDADGVPPRDLLSPRLAAANVTRKQFEDWHAAKNSALRSFLQQNSRESHFITITAPGYVHATFMDIRLLTANPDPQAALNHLTGTNITRAFFDAHLRRGRTKELVPIRHRTRQRNRAGATVGLGWGKCHKLRSLCTPSRRWQGGPSRHRPRA
jgi:hypothetical protein